MNILNDRAIEWLEVALADRECLNLIQTDTATGATIVDFGVTARGGINAGLVLAEICLANLADVVMVPCHLPISTPTAIQVTTDHPLLACMASQYAGWPVSADDYFAMASGPMRLNRGKEPVLKQYVPDFGNRHVLGVLETEKIPPDRVVEMIARECSVEPFAVNLCVAPTKSLAGMIQIVARSVEATMHKLFELEFDLTKVRHAWGIAPLPPQADDTMLALGRTNDAILYGGQVQLWIDEGHASLSQLAEQLPSNSSADYGQPFAEIFKSYNNDFYAIDQHLFSAAQITLNSLQSGSQITVGAVNCEMLATSFESGN